MHFDKIKLAQESISYNDIKFSWGFLPLSLAPAPGRFGLGHSDVVRLAPRRGGHKELPTLLSAPRTKAF